MMILGRAYVDACQGSGDAPAGLTFERLDSLPGKTGEPADLKDERLQHRRRAMSPAHRAGAPAAASLGHAIPDGSDGRNPLSGES